MFNFTGVLSGSKKPSVGGGGWVSGWIIWPEFLVCFPPLSIMPKDPR
jgi:hypothetical protein